MDLRTRWVSDSDGALRVMAVLPGPEPRYRVFEARPGRRWHAVTGIITDGSDWREHVTDDTEPVSAGVGDWLDRQVAQHHAAGGVR